VSTPPTLQVKLIGPVLQVKLVGPPGPAGSGGGGGGGGFAYSHPVASTVWTINHNLGYHPALIELSTLGYLQIEGQVQHVSVNQTVVTFNSSIAGYARLA
jgi:hypothetical protein